MHKKANIISNIVICSVLLTVSFFVFSVDTSESYVGITAPLYSGNTNTKNVSFMFIVSGSTDSSTLTKIINTLKNARSGATFFVSGSWAAKNIETIRALAAEFEIGNYGFSAVKLNISDKNKIKSEIENCHNLIMSVADVKMNLFTPPEQKYNKNTVSAAESLGYRTVLPTQNSTGEYNSGDLILLHANTDTADGLAQTVSVLLTNNFHIVSVGDNLDG
jgi:peptidoglycan/xylan/chitin deacetylase (PgdA/CDA1 family)